MAGDPCPIVLISSYKHSYEVYVPGDQELRKIIKDPGRDAYQEYTDLDWLQEMAKGPYGEENALEKLAILDHPALICAEPEKTAEYLRTAPEGVREYIKTIQAHETGVKKKCLKLLAELL